MNSETTSAPQGGDAPKPAATILLVRNADKGPEVLMVRRHAKVAFGGGAWVFPGGKVADADSRTDLWDGLLEDGPAPADSVFRIAGAREAFEEAGVLIACDDNGRIASASLANGLQGHRTGVEADAALFPALLREARLRLPLSRLALFAHWVTPTFEPRRFDTRFYMILAPDEQLAAHDGREAVDHVWIRPQDLLDQRMRGEAKLMFPTRLNLEVLAHARSAEEALAQALSRSVVTVAPEVFEREGRKFLRIPAEAGYSVSEEALERVLG
jgi:8-oxo-dGTP pyrophosphatase MutT (NUDIX family)